MCSPVLSASDPGNRSIIKGLSRFNDKPCQSCDILIQVERELQLSIELFDVNLCMLGTHQLQNAVTATCTALCLGNQGWRISDRSIRAGLECTYLPGRSQFLTYKEAEALGLPGATILLDGAHTKESAKALSDTVTLAFPEARLTVVVAMASDKDHLAFAKEILLGRQVEAIFLTEVNVGGDNIRTTSALTLRNIWIQACREVGINVLEEGNWEAEESEDKTIVLVEKSLEISMRQGCQILRARRRTQSGIIVVTGSLHIVSSVLGSLQG